MSPRSLALAAGPVVAAVFLIWNLRQSPDSQRPPESSPPTTQHAGAPPPPPTLVEPPRVLPELPREDAEWVLAEAARYQAARDLSAEDHQRLVQQLASIRQFEVIERQEPLAPQDQP